VESSSYGVSGESAQLKPRYTRKVILFPKWRVLDYRVIATKLTRLVTHAWKVHYMGLGKSLQRKCRDSLQIQPYTRKVLLNLTNRNQTYIVLEHAWTVLGGALNKIPALEVQIQPKRYRVLQVKLAYWLICRSHTHTFSIPCVESVRYGAPGKSVQWNPRYSGRITLFFKLCALNFRSIATKLTPFVPHVTKVQRVECQEIRSNGNWGTDE